MTDLEMAESLAKAINEKGGTAYFVGGYVRDKILNRENKDIDIEVYNIEPDTLRSILDTLGEHTEHGKSFGVFGLKGYNLDISMPRTERCVGNKHTDFDVTINPFISTQEGAKRRDLTMNAIMYDIVKQEYVDPYNGIEDIKNGIIRHVNSKTFVEDPLRVLRVAQFASRFTNMQVAQETIELCKRIDITTLSKERIYTELEKALLRSDKPSIFFRVLDNMCQLPSYFAEINALMYVPQSKQYHQEGDVFEHTMLAIDNMATVGRRFSKHPMELMLVTLCHDLGKIVSTTIVDGKVHSYQHELYSPEIAERMLCRITNNKFIIEYVKNLVGLHMEPHHLYERNSKIKKSNKMFDKCMDELDLIMLAYVDSRSSWKDNRAEVQEAEDERFWLMSRYEIFKDTMSKPYVKGADLVKNGFKPGEYFSDVLKLAHKLRLARISKEDALPQVLALARKLEKTNILEG